MICQELLKAIFGTLGAVLVARVGLSFYFRQKNYELVKELYLDKGIDQACSEIEAMMNIAASNWARALDVLKNFRELGNEFKPNILDQGFIPYTSVQFNHVANLRVMRLTGCNVIWQTYQLCASKHKAMNDKSVHEIPTGIRLFFEGKLTVTREDFINKSINELKDLLNASDQFAPLVAALQDLANELERDTPRSKDIDKFKERDSVKKIVAVLQSRYEKLLSPQRA